MLKTILNELKKHAPFTFLGALSGIVIILLLSGVSNKLSYTLFYIFHPIHVLLSAFVTVSLYKLYTIKNNDIKNSKQGKKNLLKIFLIGYLGSVGIATISDSIIPYLGEILLDLPNRGIHLGFIEKWYLVNPLAFLGIILANFKPSTKFPHFGHVLLSTWASLFHVMMAIDAGINIVLGSIITLVLFLSVWLPCCVSDIVFPLLFINYGKKKEKEAKNESNSV